MKRFSAALILFAALNAVLNFGTEVKAEEQKNHVFAPDHCDFQITLPGKPYTRADRVSYTMVYGLQTTIDVEASCNAGTREALARYDEEVIDTALRGMIRKRDIESADINFIAEETHRHAILSGISKQGRSQTIHMVHLLIGEKSILTVEAKLSGGPQNEADQAFSNILRSISLKEEEEEEVK